jgi:D-3-phosphoglycerate dehydrogenase
LDAAKNLEIVVRAGAGYDNIDLKSATEHGVIVMNTPGQNSNAVAELALGMMVYIARNCFNGKSGYELKGKKLGMHAYGNVGKCVAKIARGYGMELFAFDPYIDKEVIEKDGVKCVESVEELYKTCQYISLHIPVNDKTRKSIDYKLLSKMPAGATLVNTARKEIICEESLMKIFEERDNFKYVSDVAPDCKDKIKASYKERYFFTPKKIGAQTAEANINAGVAAITQIVNFFKDGDTTFKVN